MEGAPTYSTSRTNRILEGVKKGKIHATRLHLTCFNPTYPYVLYHLLPVKKPEHKHFLYALTKRSRILKSPKCVQVCPFLSHRQPASTRKGGCDFKQPLSSPILCICVYFYQPCAGLLKKRHFDRDFPAV